MVDIKKLCKGTELVVTSGTLDRDGNRVPDGDTDNIICRHGHIYADGDYLMVAADHTLDDEGRKELRKLGPAVMDGDFGELTVKVNPLLFSKAWKILRLPRRRVQKKARNQ